MTFSLVTLFPSILIFSIKKVLPFSTTKLIFNLSDTIFCSAKALDDLNSSVVVIESISSKILSTE